MRRLRQILLLLPALSLGCGQVDPSRPAAKQVGANASALTKTEKTVWALLRQQADLKAAHTMKDWKARGAFVVNSLQAQAQTSQAGLKAFLDARGAKYESFWIVNAIKITGDEATIAAVSKHPDVARIEADRVYTIPEPIRAKPMVKVTATEWGLNNIRAPQAWTAFGARGQGIVVANIDTGVDFNHPAVNGKYRGRRDDGTYDHNYNWFDPSNACGNPSLQPCDNNSHGTHTMGTMVGDDGGGNQIGVAPEAKWIAVKGCESNSCSTGALLASGQWILAPKDLNGQNPRPELRPHVVNNSWGGGSGDTWYQATVQAWVAAGIFPAFSNGNGGPSCGSSGSPGDYPESYSAGAYDINNNIASFSSRGPGLGGIIKPNIAAPGVNVRSSVPGGGYQGFSGTSMASPHVAGTVALVWSVAPSLVGDIAATRALLNSTAVNVNNATCGGNEENNNVFGEGRLDAYAAVDRAPRGPTGTLAGTVTSGGNPVARARVVATMGNTVRSADTAADGTYSMSLPVGTYSVTVSAFGYVSQTVEGVTIAEGATTTRNFSLVAAPAHPVSGVVRDGDGNAMAGARVTILNTPIPPATAGADGRYSFASVPAGTYTISASGGRCFSGQEQEVVVDGAETVDFQLPRRSDSFGYFCVEGGFSYLEANTVVPLTGDDASAPVALPFAFPFYGQTYSNAHVSTNGFLNFLAPNSAFGNSGIPSAAPPNAAIYAFWDDLVVDGSSSVRTELVGSAPNRKFVIEWRNVRLFSNESKRLDAEIVLGENGHILMQYRNIADDPEERGGSATIGIENQNGTVALQFSNGEPAITDSHAVLYRLPPSGFIEGNVTDANDGLPVVGATVRALQGNTQVRAATTARDGTYRMQIPVGTYTVEATIDDYSVERAEATVTEDARVVRNFSLRTARAAVNPQSLTIIVGPNKVRMRNLTLRNTGSLNLDFTIGETGGGPARTSSTQKREKRTGYDPNAKDTRELYVGAPHVGWAPSAPGQVIRSFTPTGLSLAWGVGVGPGENVWLSDVPTAKTNTEFTPQGAATGRQWPATWAGAWNGDMAFDTQHGLMCQVNVGGDNGIYCWNVATGAVGDSITGAFPWTATSQRGLAYRSDDDSFYIGGWNEGVIYHVKGLSHADKGAVIGTCRPADGAISGLAYNPASETLWVATNSATDTIYQVNPADCTVLSTLPHPTPGFKGGGMEMASDGNLWTISQNPNTVYLIDSGVPSFTDVPWLTVSPTSGTVAPGGRRELVVSVNTAGMASGTYLASIFIQSNSGREGTMRIPVSLIIPEYQKGVDVGSNETRVDTLGDPWLRDKAYRAGDWGYIRAGRVNWTRHRIAGTPDEWLYQTQRVDPYAYRFDGLPSGVYQVELHFAELDCMRPGDRLFDVIIDDQLVLPAHDISFAAGIYTANKYSFFLNVEDGRVDVRLIPRLGFNRPVINALRVTHRPDRR